MRDFALEVYFSRWEFKARHNLAGSEAENWSIGELLAMADAEDRAAFDGLRLGYTETFGAPALREEIARTYDAVEPDSSCASRVPRRRSARDAGAAGARRPCGRADAELPGGRDVAARSARSPGCRWSRNGAGISTSTGGEALRPEHPADLGQLPQQPDRTHPAAGDLAALVDLCDERGIWLFSDEVYRALERDPARACRRRPMSTSAASRSTSCPRRMACQGCGSAGSPAGTARSCSDASGPSTISRSAMPRPASCWR